MSKGFIIMPRGILSSPIFKKEPFTEVQAFWYLLEKANFRKSHMRSRIGIITINRGQVATSYANLASTWGWGKNRIRRFLNVLKVNTLVDTQTDTGFLIITICNYSKIQKLSTKADTQMDMWVDTLTDTPTDTIRTTLNSINKKNTKKNSTFENKILESENTTVEWEGKKLDHHMAVNILIKAYPPTHIDPTKARRVFREEELLPRFVEIMTSLQRWKNSQKWKDGYIKTLSSWLADGLWQATPPEEKNKQAARELSQNQDKVKQKLCQQFCDDAELKAWAAIGWWLKAKDAITPKHEQKLQQALKKRGWNVVSIGADNLGRRKEALIARYVFTLPELEEFKAKNNLDFAIPKETNHAAA